MVVIVRLVMASIFAALAFACYPSGVIDTPISQITIFQILSFLFSIFLGLLAIGCLVNEINQ